MERIGDDELEDDNDNNADMTPANRISQAKRLNGSKRIRVDEDVTVFKPVNIITSKGRMNILFWFVGWYSMYTVVCCWLLVGCLTLGKGTTVGDRTDSIFYVVVFLVAVTVYCI